MDHESDSKFVPRALRFEVADSSEVIVTVTRTGADNNATLSAELVDVSQHGAKLRVPTHLRFEEALQLKIVVLGTGLEYQGVASVCHIRAVNEKNNDESWVVGCAIAPPLSDEALAYLATTAGKERRRFRRLPIAAEVTIRRQAQAEGCAATLHNLSSGGFCCSSAMHYEIGERIQINIVDTEGEPRVIEARICWQVDGPDGSIVGCQFSSQSSYAELCACLTEQPVQESPPRVAEPTSKLVLTAAVLAMFVPPMITLMLQAKQVSAEASRVADVAETLEVEAVEIETAPAEVTVPTEQKLAEQKPAQANPPADKPSPLREWIDNTGKHRTEASLVEATPEYVVLLKANGHKTRVPWRRLSEADREFAKAWQARHR